jgi:glycosyltransferase involved in cell wall biosynthesis
LSKPKLLIIGFVWPEPTSTAAGTRMIQLIKAFIGFGYDITFVSASATTERSYNLENLGVQTKSIRLNDSGFDDFIIELSPQIVMFDRFMTEEQFGWRVTENCPNALKILDTEDLHLLRKGRQLALKQEKTFDDSFLYNDVTKREIAAIYRCDESLIISEEEMCYLCGEFEINPDLLLYIPFLVDSVLPEHMASFPKYEFRKRFVTIGNFRHEPNLDAVMYLKDTIWPLIKKQLPEAELHIYGAYPNNKVLQLNNEKEGFLIKGQAEDVDKVMKNSRVCLAPLRFGAGLKGKVIDAFKNATPCIMTSIAAEGIFEIEETSECVLDNPKDFAKMAVSLYNDASKWQFYRNEAIKLINERFQKETFEKRLFDTIEHLLNNLSTHRHHNFVGQLLQHHTMQSTKYMSKWIEAKQIQNPN